MSDWFSRTEMLLGKYNMEIIKNSRVAVFGVGGVGSYAAEGLARCGVQNLSLIDSDVIEPSNINRQAHATVKTVGRWKTGEMKARILDINPEARVSAANTFVLPQNVQALFEDWDFVVDAVDTVSAKLAIIETAFARRVPVISAMGAGNKLNPGAFMIADIYDTQVCPLAKVMRRELRKRNIPGLTVCYSREQPLSPHTRELKANGKLTPGSVSFVPPVAGFMIAGEVIRQLLQQHRQ